LFDFAIMKTSVIGDEFRQRYLSRPGSEGVFDGRAIVFDGSTITITGSTIRRLISTRIVSS